EPLAGLAVADADEVEPRALEHARMVAEREFLHPFQDEELDLSDLLEIDLFHLGSWALGRWELIRVQTMSWHGHVGDDVVDHHLDGHAVAGGMRPEPHAMAEDVP